MSPSPQHYQEASVVVLVPEVAGLVFFVYLRKFFPVFFCGRSGFNLQSDLSLLPTLTAQRFRMESLALHRLQKFGAHIGSDPPQMLIIRTLLSKI